MQICVECLNADDLCLTVPKKWSLPLPMVSRGSESDSTSSSWSARSADENTEDERSPIPSPSASTHSNEGSNVSVDASADEKISSNKKSDDMHAYICVYEQICNLFLPLNNA